MRKYSTRAVHALIQKIGACVRIDAIAIRPAGTRIWIDLRFTAPAGERRAAYFSLARSPLILVGHESDSLVCNYFAEWRRPFVLRTKLRPGYSWDSAALSLEFDWDAGRRRLCVFPDWGPVPITKSIDTSRRVRVTDAGLSDTGWTTGGVPDPRSGDITANEWIHFWADAETDRESIETEEVYVGLGTVEVKIEKELLRGRIRAVTAFLENECGMPCTGRLGIFDPSEVGAVVDGGSLAAIDADDLGITGPIPNEYILPLRLASYWWGGGVSIVGPGANKLIAAIAFVYSMHWLEHIGYHGVRRRVLDNIMAANGPRHNVTSPEILLRGGLAALTAHVWNQSVRVGTEEWRSIIRTMWGQSVDSRRLMDMLSRSNTNA